MDIGSDDDTTGPDSVAGAVLYVVIGLAIVSYGGYDYIQQTEAVRDSVQVDATVTERGIETDRGTTSNPGTEYEPAVKFEYTYNGAQYTGTKVYPAEIEQNYETRSAAEAAIESYEQGGETTAYVEPDEPGDQDIKRSDHSYCYRRDLRASVNGFSGAKDLTPRYGIRWFNQDTIMTQRLR